MNDMADDLLLPPPDERLSGIRDELFHDVIAAHKAAEAFNRERSRAGWWVGGIGAAIGVLGMVVAAVMSIHAKPVVRYTEIDDASGVIHESYGAKDAPAHFNERVIDHYLAEYVGLRERFVWQIDSQTYHRVQIMSSPAEQSRYAARRLADDPAVKYGVNGYASVTHFTAFTRRAEGKDNTLEYDVQFIKSELLAADSSRIKTTKMTARIVLQFHPELPMASEQDRYDNEAGLMVISYNSSDD